VEHVVNGFPLATLPPLPAEPFVSVIVAVRNEARHIVEALEAVCAQDWPRDRMEVVVADGRSTDATRELVAALAARDPRVRLLDNPDVFVAQGLNAALAEARGDVIVRVDGHCRVPRSYVRAGVLALRTGRFACAGGPVRAVGDTTVARAVARAMSTPFGVGGASFRWARDARDVDHLPFGVWPRAVFDRIGGFDPALVRNQDDEFSDRIQRAGGRIRLLPERVVDYWSRGSLRGLWRQYFGYGYWKVAVIRRRGGWPSSPRHVAPAALLLGLAGGPAFAAWTRVPAFAVLVPAAYGAFLLLAMLDALRRDRDAATALLPVALAIMHVGYGTGFLAALAARRLPPAAPVSGSGRDAEAA
jgi:glycosyltransferase involved in cell wall biosynthesis